jgi:DNA-binding NarL/FixJ family response regulator
MSIARVDLCITVARFGDDPHASENVRTAARRAAQQGCHILEYVLPLASSDVQDALRQKAEWLRQRLQDRPPAEAPVNLEGTNHVVIAGVNGRAKNGRARAETLTRREMEVLKYIAAGYSTKQVAGLLGITFKTAACHRYRVMDKLGIHETASLVRYAIRHGMIPA